MKTPLLIGVGVACLGVVGLGTWIFFLRDAKLSAEAVARKAIGQAERNHRDALEREKALMKIAHHFGLHEESTPPEIARSILHHAWSNAHGGRTKEGHGASTAAAPANDATPQPNGGTGA